MSLETPDQYLLHQTRQDQLDKSSSYINEFLQSYCCDSSSYVTKSCPTCGNVSAQVLFTKNNGQYAYCANCEHIFLKSSLRADLLLEFYKNYPTSSLDWHINESSFYQRIYKSGIDVISTATDQKKLLDIGCSSGYFLSIANKYGYQGSGVEPNLLESNYAKNAGLNVLGATIDDLPTSLNFDVITMWDVLEHIDSPISYLKRITRLLNPNGIVFVQVPTCDSLAARIMRENCNMFDGIEHLTLFSSKSLDKCFAEAGFKLVTKKSVINEKFAINNYLSYECDPYLPRNQSSNQSIDKMLSLDKAELFSLGYKIQACYTLL